MLFTDLLKKNTVDNLLINNDKKLKSKEDLEFSLHLNQVYRLWRSISGLESILKTRHKGDPQCHCLAENLVP